MTMHKAIAIECDGNSDECLMYCVGEFGQGCFEARAEAKKDGWRRRVVDAGNGNKAYVDYCPQCAAEIDGLI